MLPEVCNWGDLMWNDPIEVVQKQAHFPRIMVDISVKRCYDNLMPVIQSNSIQGSLRGVLS